MPDTSTGLPSPNSSRVTEKEPVKHAKKGDTKKKEIDPLHRTQTGRVGKTRAGTRRIQAAGEDVDFQKLDGNKPVTFRENPTISLAGIAKRFKTAAGAAKTEKVARQLPKQRTKAKLLRLVVKVLVVSGSSKRKSTVTEEGGDDDDD